MALRKVFQAGFPGLPERFPKLKVLWIESGLTWAYCLMQRLDHSYMMRTSDCPSCKRKPSEYMREMYYSSQPMEIQDYDAMQTTFRMINAETQLLYSSDYPHWDFDLPATIWDLPFLTEKGKHNVLGGTAARLACRASLLVFREARRFRINAVLMVQFP